MPYDFILQHLFPMTPAQSWGFLALGLLVMILLALLLRDIVQALRPDTENPAVDDGEFAEDLLIHQRTGRDDAPYDWAIDGI